MSNALCISVKDEMAVRIRVAKGRCLYKGIVQVGKCLVLLIIQLSVCIQCTGGEDRQCDDVRLTSCKWLNSNLIIRFD